jgi:D-inositol-3-phosphate glycosyltransferase
MARRILLVSLRIDPLDPVEGPDAGSLAVLVHDTVRGLQEQGFGVDVLTTRSAVNGSPVASLGHMGRVVRLRTPLHANLDDEGASALDPVVEEAAAWVRDQGVRRYQLVHTFGWTSAVVGRTVARMLRVPWVHNPLVLPGDLPPALDLLVQRQLVEADRVVVAHSEMADRVMATAPEARVRVVPPAVDPTLFFPRDAGPILRELGLTRRSVLMPVTAVAVDLARQVLVVWKQRAAEGLLPPRLMLLVPGGAEFPALREEGEAQTVRLLARVPHRRMPLYYAAACCTVVLAQPASLGLTALESLASGVPVVGTDTPGLRQILWDAESGLLWPTDDPAGLVDHALDFSRHPERVARWGRRGQALVHRTFTTAHMARELVRVYAELPSRLLAPAGL